MLSQVIDALKKGNLSATPTASFAVEYELNPDDLRIEVDGVGTLTFPLEHNKVQALLDISTPAKFGLREQTLLDQAVRDTQEISAHQLRIHCNGDAFPQMLDVMREALGLSENAKLTAHLHNMLIYETGQFFKPHQDSEKLEGMVATLVVVLPSPHIGGDLRIEHHKKHHQFISEHLSTNVLHCVAFYADCHHEVKKIRQGYRVALTYNLVLEPAQRELQDKSNVALEKALHAYFDEGEDDEESPTNLVYFLDHDYTEHSLKWSMLKGNDAQNTLAFRSAAKKLDLVPHLALVELHESWTTEGDEDEPEPEDLIDDSIDLTYWLDENNQKLPYQRYSISKDELCWTKDMQYFEPVETQYEGWMGNYGNTVDYWYRRAAVVLWRKSAQIAMKFQLNYDAMLSHVLALTRETGHEQNVLDMIKQAGPYLHQSSLHISIEHYKVFVVLACYIRDADVATSILAHFDLSCIDADTINDLLNLQTLYGVSWCLRLFEIWSNPERKHRFDAALFIKNMKGIVHQALDLGCSLKLLEFLLQHQLQLMVKEDKRLGRYAKPIDLNKTRSMRVDGIKQFINSCSVLQEGAITKQLVEHLVSHSALYSELDLAEIFIDQQRHMTGVHQPAGDTFKTYVTKSIQEALDKGAPVAGDCSIHEKLTCQCEHCTVAQSFLRSKTESNKVWPIITAHRDHIMDVFSGCGLPVTLSVEKKGSPYKLVMIKSDKLYQQAKTRFDKLLFYSEQMSS